MTPIIRHDPVAKVLCGTVEGHNLFLRPSVDILMAINACLSLSVGGRLLTEHLSHSQQQLFASTRPQPLYRVLPAKEPRGGNTEVAYH